MANDASTDRTASILDLWQQREGLQVIHLRVNAKKEGAILAAMEHLAARNELSKYTVLLDADTRLQTNSDGSSVCCQLCGAIGYLERNRLGALALRVNASYFSKPTVYWMSAYSTYFGLQFDAWLLSLEGRLWVINGAGGLFQSEQLLSILRRIKFNFETGDLQITVELMKAGQRLSLYDDIVGLTYVPETFGELFNQRRRWERGTMKVLWEERRFYGNLFLPPSLLCLAMVLHMVLYVGLLAMGIAYLFGDLMPRGVLVSVLTSYAIWFCIDVVKAAWVVYRRERHRFPLFVMCALVNAPVWVAVITPARLVGGAEAVWHLLKAGWRGRLGWPCARNRRQCP